MVMTITIQQALRPIFLMCFITGFGVYPVKQPKQRIRWIIYLSILYSLTIWTFYIYIIYYITTLFTLQGMFFTIYYSVVVIINILSTITSNFVSFYYQKRFEMCMIKLDAVDNTLEHLGTPKMHKIICTWSKQMIIGWVLFVLIIDICNTHFYTQRYNIFWSIILSGITNHCIHINILVDLLFVTLLWYVGNRFDIIHEHVKCLLMREELGIRYTWNGSIIIIHDSTNTYKQVFWTTMHLHLELHRIARELNLMFGMQMILQITSYLIYLTAFWYHIFLMIKYEYANNMTLFEWFMSCSWAFSLIIRLYITNCICDNVKYKANNVEKTIHQLTSIIQYADVWREIYQFTLNAIHHPLKFTGLGLFQFGHKFIWKFYIAIATFVIIMIQMKVPINPGNS